ncbi:MAG: CheR family methyltransferase [bacterium]
MRFDERPEMTPEEYALFRDYIHKQSGVYLGESKMSFLQNRIRRQMADGRFSTYRDYYRFLIYNPVEFRILLDSLTTNDTAFFRHPQHFIILERHIIPELAEKYRGRRRLKIWSAGCATGAETYSIAMVLAEALEDWRSWDIDILGTDISDTSLRVARNGIYQENALKLVDQAYISKYFERQSDGYRVKDIIRGAVRFEYHNLMNDFPVREVDILFCRNTMIYFTLEDKIALVDRFYEVVVDGGYFFMAPTETLHNRGETFEIINVDGTLIYKKI